MSAPVPNTHAGNSFGIRRAPVVMLVIDMLSDFEFPDGNAVLRVAKRIAPRIARLKARAAALRIPCVYINDNFGLWRSDVEALVRYCRRTGSKGAEIARSLQPGAKDFVILKPRHSAFYATPLASLLDEARTKRLILTGVSSHQCILFTANDAHLRHLELAVPPDCVGAPELGQTRFAIKYFRTVLGADVRGSKYALRPQGHAGYS
jgi:nicotinamidase-related amidase